MCEHPAQAAELPVKSRLAMLLAELHAEPSVAPANATAAVAGKESNRAAVEKDLSVGEILGRARQAGFGFIVAVLALMSIPLVGLTIPFGLAVAAAGLQMIAGRSQPWLPRWIQRRRISLDALRKLSRQTDRWTSRMARLVRPRLQWLTAGPFWTVCGIGLIIQGLSLTLPVPGADWLFVVPIVLYGIGLLERDGVLILVCHALTVTQIVLAIVLWQWIARGFTEVWHWCASALG